MVSDTINFKGSDPTKKKGWLGGHPSHGLGAYVPFGGNVISYKLFRGLFPLTQSVTAGWNL